MSKEQLFAIDPIKELPPMPASCRASAVHRRAGST